MSPPKQEPKPKQEPPRKKYTVAVGAVLGGVLEPALARQGAAVAQVAPHWKAICPLLAAYSCVESIRGGTVTVAVASDSVKNELHYMAPQVVDGINMLLGYEAVRKVRAVTRSDLRRPAAKVAAQKASSVGARDDKAQPLCKSGDDEPLRAALARLGALISKDKKG